MPLIPQFNTTKLYPCFTAVNREIVSKYCTVRGMNTHRDMRLQRILVYLCSGITKRKCLLLLMLSILLSVLMINVVKFAQPVQEDEWEAAMCNKYFESASRNKRQSANKTYLVTWYNLSPYIKLREDAWRQDFKTCEYSNCEMSMCKHSVEQSDAVIFNGRRLPEQYKNIRPPGQIWIFAEDESPMTFDYDGGHWRSTFWRHAFNYTMTYDKSLKNNIYLPSGELWEKPVPDNRDFVEIAKKKTKTGLIITSHCTTESKRTEFVEELQKYIDVDILGTCGKKWNCGKAWFHDDCFRILNTSYKFYLAFENALCHQYRTEKFFENYNYDLVMVERGGLGKDDVIQPRETHISTSDFASVEQLGKYLQRLSTNNEEYADLLKLKSQHYFPGYSKIYQRALCDVCKQMNLRDKGRYSVVVPDLVEQFNEEKLCSKPMDINVKEDHSLFNWFWKKW